MPPGHKRVGRGDGTGKGEPADEADRLSNPAGNGIGPAGCKHFVERRVRDGLSGSG